MEPEKNIRKKKIIREIKLPSNTTAHIDGMLLSIKGQKGEVKKGLKQNNASIKVGDGKIMIESKNDKKESKKMVNTLAAHIKNMLKGSSQSHVYILKICSGHFPMNVSVSGSKLVVKNFLGEKVPRVLQLKNNADAMIEGDKIYVTSTSKDIAGQVSADIEQLTKRPGYDKRVFEDGIYLINKDGKELK